MNSPYNVPTVNGLDVRTRRDAALKELEATLHLLAKLPAPAGLEDRLFTGVMAAPRKERLFEWPRPLSARDWVRGIAAAALVLAVGGGGWGIYAHVQPNEPAQGILATHPMFHPGGFSSADMIRRPQTLKGPVVKKAEPTKSARTAGVATTKKPTARATAHSREVVKVLPALQ